MKRLWSLTLSAALCGCPAPMMGEDAGEPDAATPEYTGDTKGGGIPVVPSTSTQPEIDAGPVVVEGTCCPTVFRIEDQEPAEATGVVLGGLPVFNGGAPLSRDGGWWLTTLCFPTLQSSEYVYVFTWDGGVLDGGEEQLEDGGVQWVSTALVERSVRASSVEPSFVDADGQAHNLFPSQLTCGGDGGVPGP